MTLDDISNALNSLCNIKSVSPDVIQDDFLFKTGDVIDCPLFVLFQKSGVFLTILKIDSLTQICKFS